MHFLSSRGLKIWVGIALLKKKEMYFLEKAAVGKKAVEKAGKGLRCRILRLHRGCRVGISGRFACSRSFCDVYSVIKCQYVSSYQC